MQVTDKMIKAYSKAMRNTITLALADDSYPEDTSDIVKAAIANGIEAAIRAMEPRQLAAYAAGVESRTAL